MVTFNVLLTVTTQWPFRMCDSLNYNLWIQRTQLTSNWSTKLLVNASPWELAESWKGIPVS